MLKLSWKSATKRLYSPCWFLKHYNYHWCHKLRVNLIMLWSQKIEFANTNWAYTLYMSYMSLFLRRLTTFCCCSEIWSLKWSHIEVLARLKIAMVGKTMENAAIFKMGMLYFTASELHTLTHFPAFCTFWCVFETVLV